MGGGRKKKRVVEKVEIKQKKEYEPKKKNYVVEKKEIIPKKTESKAQNKVCEEKEESCKTEVNESKVEEENSVDSKKECEQEKKEEVVEIIKHPLEHTWSMWLYTNETRNWLDNLVMLTSFDTVEDYWCLYHHIKPPSELQCGKDYSVFKNDVRPMWEDSANKSGGRWLINFDKKHYCDLDRIWMFVILLLIGENFAYPETICGAVVNVRLKSKIAVWVKNHKNEEAVLEVGRILKDKLDLIGRLSFQPHNSSKKLHYM